MWSLIQNLKIFSANHTELYLAGVTLFFMLGEVQFLKERSKPGLSLAEWRKN